MGTFRYPITIYSADGTQTRMVEALVDTGAPLRGYHGLCWRAWAIGQRFTRSSNLPTEP